MAYKAQIDVVLNALTTAFPEGEADFKANAEAYSAELDTLDANYTAAFGVAIEGKGIDYIVRSSLNEVIPLVQISDGHYARVRQ